MTNGFAEDINNKIKSIKRIGCGVPNVMNLRRRVFINVYSKTNSPINSTEPTYFSQHLTESQNVQ
ncbi:transposase [Anoxybacter fermentans]|uniref:transposase n=1 Tax=Anoxybacter fermentans TaxID=1323375 RepID=UPI000F8F28B3